MKTLDSSSTPSPEPTCSSNREVFRYCSQAVAQGSGSPWAFLAAAAIVVAWAIAGPFLRFADVWQLVINTVSSIVTFLMVFLIQNTQNRDTKAIQLKLDELLRGVQGARTNLVNLESLSDEELDRLQHEFERLHRRLNKPEPGKN